MKMKSLCPASCIGCDACFSNSFVKLSEYDGRMTLINSLMSQCVCGAPVSMSESKVCSCALILLVCDFPAQVYNVVDKSLADMKQCITLYF